MDMSAYFLTSLGGPKDTYDWYSRPAGLLGAGGVGKWRIEMHRDGLIVVDAVQAHPEQGHEVGSNGQAGQTSKQEQSKAISRRGCRCQSDDGVPPVLRCKCQHALELVTSCVPSASTMLTMMAWTMLCSYSTGLARSYKQVTKCSDLGYSYVVIEGLYHERHLSYYLCRSLRRCLFGWSRCRFVETSNCHLVFLGSRSIPGHTQ